MSVRPWILAARPKTLAAAAAPVIAATGLAARHGDLAWLPAGAALVGALLIQIGTNLANDYYDFVRGSDTEDRIGPLRVTQAGLLSPEAVRRGMIVTLATAVAVGVYLVWVAGWPVVWIGTVSVACAVLYTGGPFPLAYHGLGDLFVFVFFGLVAVAGTYYVQALSLPYDVWVVGVGMGAFITDILVANNLRDIESDARAGKRTLAVRIGVGGTRLEYAFLFCVALAVPPLGVALFGWPPGALAALLAGILTIQPLRRVVSFGHSRDLVPALAETARAVAVYGVLLGAGLAWG